MQGSEEWRMSRLGKVTASRVHDILKGRSGYKASRKKYMTELAIEILTQKPQDDFYKSKAMERGTEQEPFARMEYEVRNNVIVNEVDLIDHETIKNFGASPDGLINEDGSLEIKCPETHTHFDTLINGSIKPEYKTQMQCVMMCCNRKWCDFVSFDDRSPENLQYFCKRIKADIAHQKEIELEIMLFNAELLAFVKKLGELNEQ